MLLKLTKGLWECKKQTNKQVSFSEFYWSVCKKHFVENILFAKNFAFGPSSKYPGSSSCTLTQLLFHCRIDLAHDVFGRERHRLHKDDMGGVGTFDKECRTLYVGGLANRTKLEKLLWSEFGEWGEIEVKIYIARKSKRFR